MKIKTILVSQPEPKIENSPYFDLEEKQKVKIDFRPFIHVEGVTAKEIRLQKVDFSIYSAVILTSRNAVDHFFRIADEMRFKVPDSMKYFCQSEAVAYYLQKYVVYRKRKIYVGKRNFSDLSPLIKKYKNEKFLLPSSDKLKASVPAALDELGIQWKQAVFYKTVISDLSDDSLFHNFPNFKQNDTRIAVFGNTTVKAVENKGLRVDVAAPTTEMPSMTMALNNYIHEIKKK